MVYTCTAFLSSVNTVLYAVTWYCGKLVTNLVSYGRTNVGSAMLSLMRHEGEKNIIKRETILLYGRIQTRQA